MGRMGDRETINMIGRRGDGVMGRQKIRRSGHQDIRRKGDWEMKGTEKKESGRRE
jgi:hypothetical protein